MARGTPAKGFRRRFGLDRSGPPPRADPAGPAASAVDAPERDRLYPAGGDPGLPLSRPLLRRRSRRHRRGDLPGDLGGRLCRRFLARATGQYSRMGALLDPVVDRLTILSGAVVCWHFELLPSWALAILAARELITLILAQIAFAARAGAGDQLVRPDRRLPDHGLDLLRDGCGERRLGRDADRWGGAGCVGTASYIRTGLRELAATCKTNLQPTVEVGPPDL